MRNTFLFKVSLIVILILILDISCVNTNSNKSAYDSLINEALSFEKDVQYESAIQSYSKAIEINPNLALAFNNRGRLWEKLKQYDRALTDYNLAIKCDPKYAIAYFNKGQMFASQSDLGSAIIEYTNALNVDPQLQEAYTSRGIAYIYEENQDKAFQDLNKALSINPNDAEALYWRASIYNKLKEHDLAIADCTSAIILIPDSPYPYYFRGLAYVYKYTIDFSTITKEKMLEDFRKCLLLKPGPEYEKGIHSYLAIVNIPDSALEISTSEQGSTNTKSKVLIDNKYDIRGIEAFSVPGQPTQYIAKARTESFVVDRKNAVLDIYFEAPNEANLCVLSPTENSWAACGINSIYKGKGGKTDQYGYAIPDVSISVAEGTYVVEMTETTMWAWKDHWKSLGVSEYNCKIEVIMKWQ